MRFCLECDNLLMSKDKKLFCKNCGKSFEIEPNNKTDYMVIKHIRHDAYI